MLAKYFFDLLICYKIKCPLNYILYLKLSSANFDYWLPISMPYSRCPNLYSSVFCSRCRIYNSTCRQCWTNLYIQSREFKAGNRVSCALLWIPYSAQQYAIIQHRTHSYTEPSVVRHSYPECPTLNIRSSTIQSLAWYKILLWLEHQIREDKWKLNNLWCHKLASIY